MDPQLQSYLTHISIFIFFVLLGTFVNIIRNKKKWTKARIKSEVISSLWISSALVLILDNFFDWKVTAYYGIGSLAGFLNSKLIDYVGEDLIEVFIRKIFNTPYEEDTEDDEENPYESEEKH